MSPLTRPLSLASPSPPPLLFLSLLPRRLSRPSIAAKMKRGGADRLRYQIHSWVGSLYLDCVPWSVADGCRNPNATIRCPTPVQRAAFVAALQDGDIVFTASPFNISPEMVRDYTVTGPGCGPRASATSRARVQGHHTLPVPGWPCPPPTPP